MQCKLAAHSMIIGGVKKEDFKNGLKKRSIQYCIIEMQIFISGISEVLVGLDTVFLVS